MGEYRKITMNVDSLWQIFEKGFKSVKGGFVRKDEESGLEFVYPKRFYKLESGKPLKPDHMRADNGMLKDMFCQRDAAIVDGQFSYVCGTYREVDGKKRFVLSFDTEVDPDECLPNILIKYSWDKRNEVSASPIPDSVIKNANVLYRHINQLAHDYGYNGEQYFVVSTAEFDYRVVMLNYYAHFGQLINAANAHLDNFDQHKGVWRKAFKQVAKPAVESLGGNRVKMTADEMVAIYTDARKNQTRNHYRFDIVGWQEFMKDPDYGPRVPLEALDEDGLPLCIADEVCL